MIDAGRNLQNITFDTANVNALTVGTVGGNPLLLTAVGGIQTTSAVVTPQTVNCPLTLEGDYTFSSGAANSSATLAFGGGIAPAATSGLTTLTLTGSNSGANTISGTLADNGAGQLAVTMSGSGVWILGGANTYSGNTTVTGGTLRLAGGSANNIPSSLTISVGSGATLDVTGLASSTLVLGRGNVAQILTGGGTVTGTVTVNGGLVNGTGNAPAGSAITGGSGSTLTITGGLTLQNGSTSNFTLGAPNGSGSPLTAFVNVTGTAGLTVNGNHTVNLSGTAQLGTYELYAFNSGTPLATQFSIGSNTVAGNFTYTFNVTPNAEVDLVVTPPPVSADWDFNGGGNYSDNSNWNPAAAPNGVGLTATFGNGISNTVDTTSPATIRIDRAAVAGSLQFSNTYGTPYVLSNDGVTGHGITLNNYGSGASVNVYATAQQAIAADLTLADNVTFNINGGSLLSITGHIGETGGGQTVTITGGGTLTLGSGNSYTGGTTINSGIVTTTVSGALGSGPLTINAYYFGAASTLNLGGNETISGLSSTTYGGTATVNIAQGAKLTSTGPLIAYGTLNLSGNGTLEIAGAPTLSGSSNINVGAGRLRFNVASGAASVGAGVTATVASGATLELAGAVSALGTAGGPRASIANDSTAPGLLVSGTQQVVGGIDGMGSVQINAGSDLTADHIVQSALLIGGSPGSPATLTIDASDSDGNPLIVPSAFAVAGSLAPRSPFGAGTSSPSLLDGLSGSNAGTAGDSADGSNAGSARSAVPEPSTATLLALAFAAGFLWRSLRSVARLRR